MKLRTHILWAIALVVILPVTFLVLLYFGGMFDGNRQNVAVRKTVSSIYKAIEKEDWEHFSVDRYLESTYKIKVVITDAEGLILWSSFPEIKPNQAILQTLWKRLMEYSEDEMLSFWTLSELENNYSFILKNLSGYKKYDLHAGIVMRVTPMMSLHPFVRVMLIVLQFVIIAFVVIAVVIFITGMVLVMNAVNSITRDYANGDFERDLPLSKSEEGNTLISVFNKMGGGIRAEEKQRAHLLMGFSHDFKTPLALISDYARGSLSECLTTLCITRSATRERTAKSSSPRTRTRTESRSFR